MVSETPDRGKAGLFGVDLYRCGDLADSTARAGRARDRSR